MLKALYDYGMRTGLALPPGFTPKPIRAYILLSADGDFLGIEPCDKETQDCPDIGSLANSPDKCNPLAEKAEIILCDPETSTETDEKKLKKEKNNFVKKQFYHDMLRDAAMGDSVFGVCLNALETPERFKAMCDAARQLKIKGMDRITFKVSGVPITERVYVREWWSAYRKRFAKNDGNGAQMRCLITGEPTNPLLTLPMLSGLQTVGGQASGDALFCFDKASFRSYGLKQSENAPVSEEAFAVVKAALDDLLKGSPAMYKRDKNRDFNPTAPIFAGMKFVHWYDAPIEPEDDLVLPLSMSLGDDDDEDEEDEVSVQSGFTSEMTERQENQKATELIQSIQSGEEKPALQSNYYILLLSGASGRVMVRRYMHGSYRELQENLALWNQDLALCNESGTDKMRSFKLTVRLLNLLSHQKVDTKPLERLKKELAGLTPSIVTSIVTGQPLPDAVAARALARIRSEMVDPDDARADQNTRRIAMPNGICCQWLKAWLLRRQRAKHEEVPELGIYYDKNFPSAAYHCGALTAVYAAIQNRAMPEINAGIGQRFYGAASRTPLMVIGRLEAMMKNYFTKLEPPMVRVYENYLNEVSTYFKGEGDRKIPAVLNFEEQSYFAIGYRQMCAQMNHDAKEKADAKKAKSDESGTEQEEN